MKKYECIYFESGWILLPQEPLTSYVVYGQQPQGEKQCPEIDLGSFQIKPHTSI